MSEPQEIVETTAREIGLVEGEDGVATLVGPAGHEAAERSRP